MYNNDDRSWMYDRVRNGGLNQTFIDGVYRFLEYVSSQTNLLNQGKVRCPCNKCRNSKFHTTDDITWHLYSRGFLPDYYVWIAHGEFFPNTTEASSSYVPVQSPVHEGFGGRYRDMVDDAFGGRFEHINFNQEVNEEPNPEAKAFYELLQKAETRLDCGKQEIVLEFISKFMTDKMLCNTSAASCDKWLKQFHTTLSPADRRKIPKDVKGMKRALRCLGLEKKTFDLCKNNCFLFYGVYEASSNTHCPVCSEERFEPTRSLNPRAKRIPKKKVWYFPLTARLQRLYMSRATSEHMTWHLKCRGQNDTMIHPAGGDAWKSFDLMYPEYAAEPRNARLGLCTDGFTPWGRFGNSYSCWPVFVTPYNLPPDMCMRQEYIFLSLLIPGPESPGKNLDVMLRPIIDELCSLWKNGAETFDSFRKQNFVMRANLMWTLSDFPAYGMLSQRSTHGELSCPYCMEETKSFRLKHGRKPCWFDCHRRFLPEHHAFCSNTTDFLKDRVDFDAPLVRRSGEDKHLARSDSSKKNQAMFEGVPWLGGCISMAVHRAEMAEERRCKPKEVPMQEVWIRTHAMVDETTKVVKWSTRWAMEVYFEYLRESIKECSENMKKWKPLNKKSWWKAVKGAKKNYVPGFSRCGDPEFMGFETRKHLRYPVMGHYKGLVEEQTIMIAHLVEENAVKAVLLAKNTKETSNLKEMMKNLYGKLKMPIPAEYAPMFEGQDRGEDEGQDGEDFEEDDEEGEDEEDFVEDDEGGENDDVSGIPEY